MLSKCTEVHFTHYHTTTLTPAHPYKSCKVQGTRYSYKVIWPDWSKKFCRWEKFGLLCWNNSISLVYKNGTNYLTISVSKSAKSQALQWIHKGKTKATNLFQNSAPFRTIYTMGISGPNAAAHFFTRPLTGTVSWDRFQKFWPKFKELDLTKGRDWCLNFLEAPMICRSKSIFIAVNVIFCWLNNG